MDNTIINMEDIKQDSNLDLANLLEEEGVAPSKIVRSLLRAGVSTKKITEHNALTAQVSLSKLLPGLETFAREGDKDALAALIKISNSNTNNVFNLNIAVIGENAKKSMGVEIVAVEWAYDPELGCLVHLPTVDAVKNQATEFKGMSAVCQKNGCLCADK